MLAHESSSDDFYATLLQNTPCSVELPAGCGKTYLLGSCVQYAAMRLQRCLVLTHTNAGVHAIKKKLSDLGVPKAAYRVETISSWAFRLISAFQGMSGIDVSNIPNWSKSSQYTGAAITVAAASAIQRMLANSFSYMLVDEYQDCNVLQHEFILSLKVAIPRTIIFGDPLQAIFDFDKSSPLVIWDDVLNEFPVFQVKLTPYRWFQHNEELGNKSLEIRRLCVPGQFLTGANFGCSGVKYVQISQKTQYNGLSPYLPAGIRNDETVLVLVCHTKNEDDTVARLYRGYQVIEDIAGTRIEEALCDFPSNGDVKLSYWVAKTLKRFCGGLGNIDKRVLDKLRAGKTVSHLKRKDLGEVLAAFDYLLNDRSYEAVLVVIDKIINQSIVYVHHREAVNDLIATIRLHLDSGDDVVTCLHKVRSRFKYMDRKIPNRAVSRTYIVKGLEFDHVVILVDKLLLRHKHFYVAFTRARKSVTILSTKQGFTLTE